MHRLRTTDGRLSKITKKRTHHLRVLHGDVSDSFVYIRNAREENQFSCFFLLSNNTCCFLIVRFWLSISMLSKKCCSSIRKTSKPSRFVLIRASSANEKTQNTEQHANTDLKPLLSVGKKYLLGHGLLFEIFSLCRAENRAVVIDFFTSLWYNKRCMTE